MSTGRCARLIFMSLWGFGGAMLIYLAGLQGVPKELYEAAQVDGASRFRQHLHVTVPILSPVTFFNLILGVIGALQVFAEPFVLTKGGPNNSTLLLSLYLYQNAFQYLKMGYASAIAWVTFAIIMVFTLLVFRSMPVWVHYRGRAMNDDDDDGRDSANIPRAIRHWPAARG